MTPLNKQPGETAGRAQETRFPGRMRKLGKRGARRRAMLRAAAGAETSYLLSLRHR
jgi:hypothetical protein